MAVGGCYGPEPAGIAEEGRVSVLVAGASSPMRRLRRTTLNTRPDTCIHM